MLDIFNLIFNSEHSAEWFGSIATSMAVIVSLYISLKKSKLKITYEIKYEPMFDNKNNLSITFFNLNNNSVELLRLHTINFLHKEAIKVCNVDKEIDSINSIASRENYHLFNKDLYHFKQLDTDNHPTFNLQNNKMQSRSSDINMIISSSIGFSSKHVDNDIRNYSIQYVFKVLHYKNKSKLIKINLNINELYENNVIQRIENLDVFNDKLNSKE